VRRAWLRRAVDLDDVAIGIELEELGETGEPVPADHDTRRVVLRRVLAKTVGSQRGEGLVEIVGAESKMTIVAVDLAGPEGAGRIESQMHLQGAAGKPGTDALERRPLDNGEAKQLLIKGERPREIGDDCHFAFSSEAKGKADGEPPFDEPPQWTWGVVQEGLEELARATGKSVEKILLAVCKQAAEQRQEALEALEQGVQQLERCLVHDGTPFDSRVPF